MSPEERDAIRAAGRDAATDAPPLPSDAVEMLRRDGCPIFARKADRSAA